MAKRIKRRKSRKYSKAVAVSAAPKTRTRTVFVKARRSIRKAVSGSVTMSKKDIILSVAGAGVGGIGGAIVLSKIPGPEMVKNGATAALGGALIYMAAKKRNKLLMGAGFGMAAVGVQGIIAGFIPSANAEPVNGVPYYAHTQLAAPFAGSYEPLNAPFAGSYEPLNAPFDGDDTTI